VPSTQEVRLPAIVNERLLQIPDYQRPYAWRRKQLEDLWEDLDLLGPSGSHYAGTLVLRDVLLPNGAVKSSVADDGSTLRHCEVVDGQQRLTTCFLLLDRVRRRLDVLARLHVEFAADVRDRIRTTYGMVGVNRAQTPRLRLGVGLNEHWVNISLGDRPFVGNARIGGEARLHEAAEFFDEKIASLAVGGAAVEFVRLKDLQSRITAGLGFLVYEVHSAAEVGVIFETLNERGRDLTDLEKTKNYLLYLARSIKDGRSDQLGELINEAWADIFRNLAGNDEGDADDQLLRAHWLATQNPVARDWKRIASIKTRFDRSQYISGETRIVPTTKQGKDQDDAWDRLFEDLDRYVTGLRDCSFFLSEMFDSGAGFLTFSSRRGEARERSAALARSGVVALYRPLLFASRLKHPQNGELYARLVDLCERYSARVFVIRQRRANAGEARLFRLAHDLFTGATPDDVLKEVAALLWRYASDGDIQTAMESTRENWYGRRGHKYFLYEYERSINPHPQDLPPLSAFTGATEHRTTEHVLPQHPAPHDRCWWDHFSQEHHAGLVHSLGNLALTYDNSSYGRKCFDEKRGRPMSPGEPEARCYAQAPLMQERLLAQYGDWTPEAIERRQKQLAAWALKRWSVEPPTAEEITVGDVEIEPECEPESL
jgi:hypothetical protein